MGIEKYKGLVQLLSADAEGKIASQSIQSLDGLRAGAASRSTSLLCAALDGLSVYCGCSFQAGAMGTSAVSMSCGA